MALIGGAALAVPICTFLHVIFQNFLEYGGSLSSIANKGASQISGNCSIFAST